MRQRSSYPKPFKAQVVQECLQPGASVRSNGPYPTQAAAHASSVASRNDPHRCYLGRHRADGHARWHRNCVVPRGGGVRCGEAALRLSVAGYKAGFELGITEIGCMAHARRKFFDLHVANKSQLAEQALHSIGDGAVPIDNNPVENTIRPWALGRSNWLLAGSLRSGKRAAAIMSLIQSARMNGHDPYAYLKDVLTRLPTQRASEIGMLLPQCWTHSSPQAISHS